MLKRPQPYSSSGRFFCKGTLSVALHNCFLTWAGVRCGFLARRRAAAAATCGAAIDVPGQESYRVVAASSLAYRGTVERIRSPGATSEMWDPVQEKAALRSTSSVAPTAITPS